MSKQPKYRHSILILLVLSLMAGCSKVTYEKMYPTLYDGKYDTEFPYKDCSRQLDAIASTVKKVFCLADYETYTFDPDQQLMRADIEGISIDSLKMISLNMIKTSEASSGTGTIIHYAANRIALLTCAHLLYFKDTVYTYYEDNDPATRKYLQGVSIKTRQRNFFRDHHDGHELEILAIDREKDLALIGKYVKEHDNILRPFPYPLGRSKKLEWGSFVYVMGYPIGYQMITRGIVSRPKTFKLDHFLIDAAFNEGFSGGVVLAIKDGVPNFEMVGVGKSASGSFESTLVPEKQDHEFLYNPDVPYSGEVYVNLRKKVNYGITYAISTQAIRSFYKDNKLILEMNGYYLDRFFEKN